jgi:Protein of unknown function (DUF3800)
VDKSTHYFVDESGDGVLFGTQGRVLLGEPEGRSHFMLGVLQVPQPQLLAAELEALRQDLLKDPYFKNVASMQPERNARGTSYRYRPDELYDQTVARLFKDRLHSYEACRISYGVRGTADRTRAFQNALTLARIRFEQKWGKTVTTQIDLIPSSPRKEPCLQAVDYMLWALHRYYSRQEGRFIELMWDKVGLIHAVDDKASAAYGSYYTKKKPLPELTGAAS